MNWEIIVPAIDPLIFKRFQLSSALLASEKPIIFVCPRSLSLANSIMIYQTLQKTVGQAGCFYSKMHCSNPEYITGLVPLLMN